jgi:hypothetical protein
MTKSGHGFQVMGSVSSWGAHLVLSPCAVALGSIVLSREVLATLIDDSVLREAS